MIRVVGIVFGFWMGAGRWLFGVGGELTWWYVPAITVPFILLQLYVVRRIRIAEDRARPIPTKVFGALVLSWLCALGFGLTVPDVVGGELVTITSHWWGASWVGMSIALCNPLGIIAFAMVIAAAIFAGLAGRDPRPSEDDLLDAVEASATGADAGHGEEPALKMVDHPLKPQSRSIE